MWEGTGKTSLPLTDPKEEFDECKHGGDSVGELSGDGTEAASEEGRVSAGLDNPEDGT